MKLIDQTRFGAPYVLVSSTPHPNLADDDPRWKLGKWDLEDETIFPRPKLLPREIADPPAWSAQWGLVTSEEADPSGQWILAEIVPQPHEGVHRVFGLWSSDGRLVRISDDPPFDALWVGSHLLEGRWAEEGFNELVLIALPELEPIQRALIGPNPHADKGACGQRFASAGAPEHFFLYSATGHGEWGFELVVVEPDGIRRLHVSSDELMEVHHVTLSPDARWLVYVGCDASDLRVLLVDLVTSRTTRHDIATNGETMPDEGEVFRFDSSSSQLSIVWGGGLSGESPLPLEVGALLLS